MVSKGYELLEEQTSHKVPINRLVLTTGNCKTCMYPLHPSYINTSRGQQVPETSVAYSSAGTFHSSAGSIMNHKPQNKWGLNQDEISYMKP